MTISQKTYCVLMRGGTSRGPFFLKEDLPSAVKDRDALLLKVMGSPHVMQVDGIGGGQAQTSKVAIISPSDRDDADVNYLFAQVLVEEARVDTSPNCGNMLSGVGPFAIEEGLVKAEKDTTWVRIFNENTGAVVHAEVKTPDGKVSYEGDQKIDGVNDTSAPIFLHFLNAEGVKTGHFFPTQKVSESIDNIDVTLIDYSVPMMLVKAIDLGLNGSESAEDIDKNTTLLKKIEAMRVEAGKRMGLGDVSKKVIPKVGILSNSNTGIVKSHYLMPHKCHKSHAITGAMCIASASYIEGTVVSGLVGAVQKTSSAITIEHPSGQVDLNVVLEEKGINGSQKIRSIAVVRTARRIFEGFVLS